MSSTWIKPGQTFEEAIEDHRQTMIAHFIRMRYLDQDLARHSLASYVAMRDCPVPTMADDVRTAWAAEVERMRIKKEQAGAESGRAESAPGMPAREPYSGRKN